jgi:hypothetical protein
VHLHKYTDVRKAHPRQEVESLAIGSRCIGKRAASFVLFTQLICHEILQMAIFKTLCVVIIFLHTIWSNGIFGGNKSTALAKSRIAMNVNLDGSKCIRW